jgi:hypothetical protein
MAEFFADKYEIPLSRKQYESDFYEGQLDEVSLNVVRAVSFRMDLANTTRVINLSALGTLRWDEHTVKALSYLLMDPTTAVPLSTMQLRAKAYTVPITCIMRAISSIIVSMGKAASKDSLTNTRDNTITETRRMECSLGLKASIIMSIQDHLTKTSLMEMED